MSDQRSSAVSLRALRAVAPVALVIAVAVHGTLGGLDAAESFRTAYRSDAGFAQAAVELAEAPAVAGALESAARAGEAASVIAWATVPGAVSGIEVPVVKTPQQLSREQANIAKFIAARYRVTLEATTDFVHHAYLAARDAKIDPMLVLAVMSVESSFDPRAQSSAGAQGLMQVLTRVHLEKFLPFGGIRAAFDPVANIRVGSSILKEYIQREGSVEGALKSYVGAALLENDGGYGAKVLNARERIAAAAAGKPLPAEVYALPSRSEKPLMVKAVAMTQESSLAEPRISEDGRVADALEPAATVQSALPAQGSVPAAGAANGDI